MSPVAAGLIAVLAGVCAGVSADEPREAFRLKDSRIVESSSLVVARTEPDLVFTANDGPATRVYAVDMTTGETVGTVTLTGIHPLDVEAMAPGPDGALYLADIGDNESSRHLISVYRIDEPGRGNAAAEPQRFDLAYPDGPRDAETLIVEPGTGRLIVVSKEVPVGTVYVAPTTLSASGVNRLRAVATSPALVTDGAVLPGGDTVALRTYTAATTYRLPDWTLLRSWRLPTQRQGESLAALPDSGHVLVGSEGPGSVVLPVRVPPAHRPGVAATPPAEPAPAPPTRDMQSHTAVIAVLAVGLVGTALAILARARRHG